MGSVNIKGNEAAAAAAKDALAEELPEGLKTTFSDLRAATLCYIKKENQAENQAEREKRSTTNSLSFSLIVPTLLLGFVTTEKRSQSLHDCTSGIASTPTATF